jgi:hypothetical protein
MSYLRMLPLARVVVNFLFRHFLVTETDIKIFSERDRRNGRLMLLVLSAIRQRVMLYFGASQHGAIVFPATVSMLLLTFSNMTIFAVALKF